MDRRPGWEGVLSACIGSIGVGMERRLCTALESGFGLVTVCGYRDTERREAWALGLSTEVSLTSLTISPMYIHT